MSQEEEIVTDYHQGVCRVCGCWQMLFINDTCGTCQETDLAFAYRVDVGATDITFRRHYVYFKDQELADELGIEEMSAVHAAAEAYLAGLTLDPDELPQYPDGMLARALEIRQLYQHWQTAWKRLFSHVYGSDDHHLIYEGAQSLRLQYEVERSRWDEAHPDMRWMDVAPAWKDGTTIPPLLRERLEKQLKRSEA